MFTPARGSSPAGVVGPTVAHSGVSTALAMVLAGACGFHAGCGVLRTRRPGAGVTAGLSPARRLRSGPYDACLLSSSRSPLNVMTVSIFEIWPYLQKHKLCSCPVL